MMNRKIIIAKNIMITMLMAITLMNMLQSCAKAYTYENFLTFVEQCREDTSITNTSPYYLKSRADFIHNYQTNIENIMNSNNDSPNNYNAFVTITDDGYNYLIMSNNNNYEYELNTTVSGYSKTFYITGTLTIVSYKSGNFNYYKGGLARYTTYSALGLLTKDARVNNQAMYNTQYNKKAFYLQNNYITPVVAFETAPLNETLQNGKEVVRLQYRMNDLYLGHFINLKDNNITEVEYTISFNNGTWAEHGNTHLSNINNNNENLYMSGDSVYIKPILLNYYNTYEFNWGAWNNANLIQQGTIYYYVLPLNAIISNGEITNYGSGEPYNTQDSTIDIINNNKDIIDKLFKPDTEKIQNTMNTLMQNNFITSGEVPDIIILENIETSGDDFIISWNNYTPNFTIKGTNINQNQPMIPAGQINFSKIERENQTLHYAMMIERTILGLGLMTLMFREYYITLAACLGDNVFVFGQDKDSKEVIRKGSNTK